jgi:hypothetical protein
MAGADPVADMPPVVGRDLASIDAGSFHRVDMAEHLFDLGPAFDLEQNVAARTHERQRLIGFARLDGAHDVDARDDGAEVVGRPADEGEDAAGAIREDAPPRSSTCSWTSRPNLIQFSIRFSMCVSSTWVRLSDGNADGMGPPRAGTAALVMMGLLRGLGNSRASRSRSMSATVMPRRNAAILIRPRSSGVTSMVSRAVKLADRHRGAERLPP